MIQHCDLERQLVCPACGYRAKRYGHKRICQPAGHRPAQTAAGWRPVAVGDLVAAGLSAVGITPQLVQRVTGRKKCGCKQRQQALNEAGYAVQRTLGQAAVAVKEFYVGK
ncbi:MAG: hypothetical protein EBU54_15590 [Mycobacteriaceae bacterium]|nr:hypothetical protein [Mycobacteriaceae bacterium]